MYGNNNVDSIPIIVGTPCFTTCKIVALLVENFMVGQTRKTTAREAGKLLGITEIVSYKGGSLRVCMRETIHIVRCGEDNTTEAG